MDLKKCFVCLTEQPIENFYAHPKMADGHLGKCKRCTREDVKENRSANLGRYQTYDRERYQRPERKAATKASAVRQRQKFPEKYRARTAVGNALRDGRLVRSGCEVCGERAEAHHADYSKPLEVRWLCKKHHEAAHH